MANGLPTLKQDAVTPDGAPGIKAVVSVLAAELQVVVPAALVNTLLAITDIFPAVVPLGFTTTVLVVPPDCTTHPLGNVHVKLVAFAAPATV